MKFIKIIKLENGFGSMDYKGADIDLFIPGSQVYSIDHQTFLGATTEEVLPMHTDLIEITEIDYAAQKAEIIASYPLPKEEQNEVKIALLETTLQDLILGGTV